MSNKALRGMKRVCQSEECGLPFYDLRRTDISCPNCGTIFVPPPVREISLDAARRPPPSRRPGRPMFGSAVRAVPNEVADEPALEAETEAEVTEDDIDETTDDEIATPATEVILEADDDPGIELDAPHEVIKDD